MAKKEAKFTPKQQLFIDYFDSNASEAAEKAGYKSFEVEGPRLLRNAKIAKAIKLRQIEKAKPDIASREDRQKFWADMMKDKKVSEKYRLKASELLGKSEGDFLDRIKHEGGIDIKVTVIDSFNNPDTI